MYILLVVQLLLLVVQAQNMDFNIFWISERYGGFYKHTQLEVFYCFKVVLAQP